MVEIICDTSFLIQLATRRIKNIDSLDTEIGSLSFVVPEVVKNELFKLENNNEKKHEANTTLKFIKNLKTIPISGNFADKELLEHVKLHGGIIGTMDKILKKNIKQVGGSVLSLSNDKIILES